MVRDQPLDFCKEEWLLKSIIYLIPNNIHSIYLETRCLFGNLNIAEQNKQHKTKNAKQNKTNLFWKCCPL